MKDTGNNLLKLQITNLYRDSSYDSMRSYKHESHSSFGDLNTGSSMPVRSDMQEMRRYGSANSLSMTRDLRLSTASGDSTYSDDKQDMYQSSPDLSQDSLAVHTRSSSTDSADSSSRSRHLLGSVASPRLTTGGLRRPNTTTTLTADPLQFVKIKSAQDLALQAKKQMQIAREANKLRISIDSSVDSSTSEPDWQLNFLDWKTKRCKSGYVNVATDFDKEELQGRKSHKTFSEIISKKDKMHNVVAMNLYPTEDDNSGLGEVKAAQDEPLVKSQSSNAESQSKSKKSPSIVPWTRDSSGNEDNSQSDSETNHSQQFSDTDCIFSDKSTPSKILSDHDTWVKSKPNTAKSSKSSPLAQRPKFVGDNVKLWEENANEFHKKERSGEKVDISITGGKIKNMKQAFELNEKVAPEQPASQRQSEYRLRQGSSQSRKSQDSYDDSSPRFPSPFNRELVSATSPKALLPMEPSSLVPCVSHPIDNSVKNFMEFPVQFNQRPNNNKGFGFALNGGSEKKKPITVQRVALGSAADVNDLRVSDEILAVNGRDVSSLTLAQVQGIVEHSLKRGTIDLMLRRYFTERDNDVFKNALSLSSNGDGNCRNQSKPDNNNISTSLKSDVHIWNMSSKEADTAKPQIMDQLMAENQREANIIEKPTVVLSPVLEQQMKLEVTVNSCHTSPSKQTSEILQQTLQNDHKMSAPREVTMIEDKSKMSVKKSLMNPTEKVQIQQNRTSATLDPSLKPLKAEAPLLAQSPDSSVPGDSSLGPPAALLRWQRPRPKSEHFNVQISTEKNERPNRHSVTMPLSWLEKVDQVDSFDKPPKDFVEHQSVSDMHENKSRMQQSNDTKRFEEWQQKPDHHRMPAAPLQTEAPCAMAQVLSQKKHEKDSQWIRQQYEGEKKRAREAGKQKQDKMQVHNSDKHLCDIESPTIKTKNEAANLSLPNLQPTVTTAAEQRFSSEPLAIKFSSASQGRALIIDPRNQQDAAPRNWEDIIDSLPSEYSFNIDLAQSESSSSVCILNQPPELFKEELLAREREKIREEEKQRVEEEQKKWKEEQEKKLREEQEKIRQERVQLQMEQERVQQEKALLEQKRSYEHQIVNNNLHIYASPIASADGVCSSPSSPSPTLDPKACEKKILPPTAPKPDKSKLMRDDLIVMNCKPTPLSNQPEIAEDASPHETSLPAIWEPPSKSESHTPNAVSQQKFHNSALWIKGENVQNEKPFVIGKRSDLIHKDSTNIMDHWVVQEAERRRLAEQAECTSARNEIIDSTIAHSGPTKPSQSAFRDEKEPLSHSNRFSSLSSNIVDSHLSPVAMHPLPASGSSLSLQYERNANSGGIQFNAKTQPSNYLSNTSLSQTLPPNVNFSINSRHSDSSTKCPKSADQEPVIAVSGRQKCSHCAEELGFGAAMVIESLALYYHIQCFYCCVCRTPLGNGSEGTDVRVHFKKLHCTNCYNNDEAGLKFSKV